MNMNQNEPLEILYQDAYLVAVNKPAGLLVHKSPIDKHETRFALQEVRDQIGAYVYPVHRLDKPTSGILLFALDKDTAQKMAASFRNNEVKKEYVSVVRGYTDEAGLIDHPLKQMLDTKAQKQKGITKEVQDAQTKYIRLATVELPYAVSRYKTARYSLVRLYPQTGRKHQLRRHMKHIHHHMVGDTKHGRGEHNRLFREHFNLHRLLLHASAVKFVHPVYHKEVLITSEINGDFGDICEKFGWGSVLYAYE